MNPKRFAIVLLVALSTRAKAAEPAKSLGSFRAGALAVDITPEPERELKLQAGAAFRMLRICSAAQIAICRKKCCAGKTRTDSRIVIFPKANLPRKFRYFGLVTPSAFA